MQHGQEEDAFQGQLEASAGQQSLDDLGNCNSSHSRPKISAGPMRRWRWRVALPMRGEHHHGFGELGPRLQQAVELAALLQLIQPSHGGDDALLAAAFFPAVLDDLQIDVVAGSFLAEEHGGLLAASLLPP